MFYYSAKHYIISVVDSHREKDALENVIMCRAFVIYVLQYRSESWLLYTFCEDSHEESSMT